MSSRACPSVKTHLGAVLFWSKRRTLRMSITLSSGTVKAHGYELLSRVSSEVDAEADPNGHGLFLSARSKSSSSRLVFDLGCVPELKPFTLFHRYEPHWLKTKAR